MLSRRPESVTVVTPVPSLDFIPFAFDLDVAYSAQQHCLDQVVGDIGVNAGLNEFVDRGASRSAGE